MRVCAALPTSYMLTACLNPRTHLDLRSSEDVNERPGLCTEGTGMEFKVRGKKKEKKKTKNNHAARPARLPFPYASAYTSPLSPRSWSIVQWCTLYFLLFESRLNNSQIFTGLPLRPLSLPTPRPLLFLPLLLLRQSVLVDVAAFDLAWQHGQRHLFLQV